jgi:hypothetical protein
MIVNRWYVKKPFHMSTKTGSMVVHKENQRTTFEWRTLLHSGAAYLFQRAAAAGVTLSLAISFCKQSGGPLLAQTAYKEHAKSARLCFSDKKSSVYPIVHVKLCNLSHDKYNFYFGGHHHRNKTWKELFEQKRNARKCLAIN